jgi:hypothetical protein
MECDAVAASRDRNPPTIGRSAQGSGISAANDADAVVRRIPAHKGGAEVDRVLDIGDPGDGVFLSWLITGETRK